MRGFAARVGQIAAFVLFALIVGYFVTSPAYTYHDLDKALLKLSFTHAGHRKEECRQLTADEIAALPPNMRLTQECARERVPVHIKLIMDGKTLANETLLPSGFWHDGASTAYMRFSVNAGRHILSACLRDSPRTEGCDYQREAEITIKPKQNYVVDFRVEQGGFYFE